MSSQTEDCWLVGEDGMKTEGCNDSISNAESFFDLNETTKKVYSGPLLPKDEEMFKEYQDLQDKIKKATDFLAEKENELSGVHKEFEQNIRKCQQMKTDLKERAKLLEKRTADLKKSAEAEEIEISKLEQSCDKELKEIQELEKDEENMLQKMNEKEEPSHQALKNLEMLEILSDIAINYIEDAKISFSILRKRNNKDEITEKIEVVLSFKDSTHKQLVSVQVYPEKFSWNDLVDAALREGKDATWLLNSMKGRYQNTYGLEEEIEVLQNRFAIDWLPEEKLVTVILPGKGQSICKLKVNDGYPSSQDIECVYADDLMKDKVNSITEMVKAKEVTSLTSWLEHLHC